MSYACNVSDDEQNVQETWNLAGTEQNINYIFSAFKKKNPKQCLPEISILFYSNSAICVNQTLIYLVTNQ